MRQGFLDSALRGMGVRPHVPNSPEPTPRFQPAEVVLPASIRRAMLLVPLAVLMGGFVALLLFWLGGEPRAGVPGLFDYAAATLGDGLLLPLLALVCILAFALVPHPAPRERGWTLAGVLCGLGVGTLIQAVWLLDSSPHVNWTLVAPHELNTAGRWHSAFFVLAAGLFGGLALRVALRIRRSAGPRERGVLIESGWLAAATFCALGFLGLAASDNLGATGTQAGLATALGVSLATALFVAGVAWAFRFAIRVIAAALLLGLGAAIGLTFLASYGLPIPPGATTAGVAISVGLGAGLNATRFASIRGSRGIRVQLWIAAIVRALLSAVALLGVLGLALHLVGSNGLVAALVVVGGAALAGATNRDPSWAPGDLVLRSTAVAYSIGLIALSGWVGEERTSAEANYAVGFAAFFLDGLVLGMIRQQFARVIRSDFIGRDESGRETKEVGTDTTIQVFAFGFASLLSLATLFAVAASPLGLEVGNGFPDVEYGELGLALAVALGLTIGARLRARHADPLKGEPNAVDPARPRPVAGQQMNADAGAVALAVAGLAVWLVALLGSAVGAGLNMIPAAVIGGCLIGLMAVEDVIRSCTRLQLHSPDSLSLLVAGAVGATVATGLFFVLAAGLWDEGAPASATAAMVALLVPVATIFLAWLASSPVAYGLTYEKLTPQTPDQNVLLVQGLYAGLALIALILPMIAIGRIDAIDPDDVGLVAVTSLAFLPPLIGAFVWVLGNNTLHLELQLEKLDTSAGSGGESSEETRRLRSLLERFDSKGGPSSTEQWKSWMSTHIRFQNRAALAVMLVGFAWMAAEVLL